MKLKILSIVTICIIMCFILTGCGKTNESAVTSENNDTEQEVTSDTTEVVKKEIKIADTWMSQPKNVDLVWRIQEK